MQIDFSLCLNFEDLDLENSILQPMMTKSDFDPGDQKLQITPYFSKKVLAILFKR
jgi:hypothetical protein